MYFYNMTCLYAEGRAMFGHAIDALKGNDVAEHQLLLGRLLSRQAWFFSVLHQSDDAARAASRALQIALETRDRPEEAFASLMVANGPKIEAVSTEHLEYVASLYAAEGNEWGPALTLYWLGKAYRASGDLAEAQRYWEACESACNRAGNNCGAADVSQSIAVIMTDRGQFEAARQRLEKCLLVEREMGTGLVTFALSTLAWNLACTGEYEAAQDAAEEALALRRSLGQPLVDVHARLAVIRYLAADIAQAEHAAHSSIAAVSENSLPGELSACGWAVLAATAVERGEYESALALGQESLSHLADIDQPMTWLPVSAMVRASTELGSFGAAWEYWQQGADLLGPGGPVPQRLFLSGIGARLLALIGETEQALRLAALVQQHPASMHRSRVDTAQLLASLEGELGAATLQEAQYGLSLDRLEDHLFADLANGHRE